MADNKVERRYEVREIFPEKDYLRVIHFNLRDNTGNSLLAAVGIEKTINHITYSISEDFIRVFGSTSTANAQTRWKAKWQVINWLKSLISERRPIFTDPSQKLFKTEPSAEYVMSLMARFSNRLSNLAGEGSSNSQPQNSGIAWSGNYWICSKQLRHYPAFCRSGTAIPVYSFVFFMSKVGADCLGYVEDLYEDMKGNKLVRVRWFHFHKEMENRIPNLDALSNEVFITSNELVLRLESIDGVAAVLSPNHFKKCLSVLPRGLSLGSFVCHRQYKKNKIKPFRLSDLRGYPTQPILSSLECPFPQPRIDEQHSTEKAEGSEPLKTKLSSQGPVKFKFMVPEPRCQVLFKVNDNVEILSGDIGLRGCWFRCKILHCSQKFVKVQHHDVLNVDGSRKLEERVPSSRVAKPDKLGMRCAGRLTIRPWPCEDLSDVTFEIGAAVDAWWNDGWWEGVVTGSHNSKENTHQVYFPGENNFLTVDRTNIRASKDWINNKWIDIKAKPDILSFLSSIFNPTPKFPLVPVFIEATGSSSLRVEGSSSKSVKLKVVEELNLKKRWIIRNNEEKAGIKSGNAGSHDTKRRKSLKQDKLQCAKAYN